MTSTNELTSMAETFKSDGNERFKAGNFAAAIQCYSRAISLAATASSHPGSNDPHNDRMDVEGEDQRKRKKKVERLIDSDDEEEEEEEEEFQDAVAGEVSPMVLADCYGNRSAAFLRIGEYARCLEDCATALSLNPMHMKVRERQVRAQMALGQLIEAKDSAQRMKEFQPAVADALLLDIMKIESMKSRVIASYEDANYLVCLSFVEELRAASQLPMEMHFIRLQCLLGMKRYDEVLKESAAILRGENAQRPDILYVRAMAMYQMQDIERAVKIWSEVLKMDPDFEQAKVAFKAAKKLERTKEEGNTHFRRGNYAEAVTSYTAALALTPRHFNKYSATLCSNRAAARMKLRQWEEAVQDCNLTLEWEEGHEKALGRRAECKVMLSDFNAAIADYKTLSELYPEKREYRQKIANTQKQAKMAARKNYYAILEVGRDASDAELKKAYKKKSLQWHPDKNMSGSEAEKAAAELKFKDVNEAYSVLSDEQKRSIYDSGGDPEGQDGGMGGAGGMDMNDIFAQMFAQQQGGFGGRGGGFAF
jgi:DnaJ homolog subfamily C member 7